MARSTGKGRDPSTGELDSDSEVASRLGPSSLFCEEEYCGCLRSPSQELGGLWACLGGFGLPAYGRRCVNGFIKDNAQSKDDREDGP